MNQSAFLNLNGALKIHKAQLEYALQNGYLS